MAKKRPSAFKREREYRKRQRAARKSEKAAIKRERREQREDSESQVLAQDEAEGGDESSYLPPRPTDTDPGAAV